MAPDSAYQLYTLQGLYADLWRVRQWRLRGRCYPTKPGQHTQRCLPLFATTFWYCSAAWEQVNARLSPTSRRLRSKPSSPSFRERAWKAVLSISGRPSTDASSKKASLRTTRTSKVLCDAGCGSSWRWRRCRRSRFRWSGTGWRCLLQSTRTLTPRLGRWRSTSSARGCQVWRLSS